MNQIAKQFKIYNLKLTIYMIIISAKSSYHSLYTFIQTIY